jgi:hypothetical protein
MYRAGRAAVIITVVVAFWLGRASAQGTIPNGVFVRNSEGGIWLVLDGQRVRLPIWQAADEEIAGLPLADRWAVMNDAGAIIAGDRPLWLGEPVQTVASPEPSEPARFVAPLATATSTPTRVPVAAPPARDPGTQCGAVASRIVTTARNQNPIVGTASSQLTLGLTDACRDAARRDGENGVACFEGAWLTLAPLIGQPGAGRGKFTDAADELYASCMRGQG